MLYVCDVAHCPYGQVFRLSFQQPHPTLSRSRTLYFASWDMFFSTGIKLYHRTQNFEKWNKEISFCESLFFVLLFAGVHLRHASRINIACPHGHSNILYLWTCTIYFIVSFDVLFAPKSIVLCQLCILAPGSYSRVDCSRFNFSVENFLNVRSRTLTAQTN